MEELMVNLHTDGVVHPKIYMCWSSSRVLVSSNLKKCRIPSLAYQWILWSEWVPSEILSFWIFKDVNLWTGVVCIIVMSLSAVWTLILTAPIHCRASIGEQVMECYISPNLMKKPTHLHRWPEAEYIFSFVCTIPLIHIWWEMQRYCIL